MCVHLPHINDTMKLPRKDETLMKVAIKEKRIEFRVSEEAKNIIEQAAFLSNISLSSYILSVVLKQAKLDLKRNAEIILNDKDIDSLLKNMNNPPKPNEELKKLVNSHK